MTWWETVTWSVARAGGFTAYALLALSVIVGLALSAKWQSQKWPRLINSELHNFLGLLALVFTVVHVGAVWLDPYTKFGWYAIFVPFASNYRPIWMALGIVGLYLGLAIAASVWLRPMIGYRVWRTIHYLTFGVYLLTTVHGIFTGTDTQSWWAIAIYAASLLTVGTLFWLRITQRPVKQPRPHAVPPARAKGPVRVA
jgi:predicted ferric reductase